MTATLTTLTIDGVAMRAVDIGGLGSGPYAPLTALIDADGNTISNLYPLPIASRGDPARQAIQATSSTLSDTADHATTARPPMIANRTDGDIRIVSIPVGNADTDTVGLTIPSGSIDTLPWVTRRILVTGSTGLAAGLTAGTIDLILLVE